MSCFTKVRHAPRRTFIDRYASASENVRHATNEGLPRAQTNNTERPPRPRCRRPAPFLPLLNAGRQALALFARQQHTTSSSATPRRCDARRAPPDAQRRVKMRKTYQAARTRRDGHFIVSAVDPRCRPPLSFAARRFSLLMPPAAYAMNAMPDLHQLMLAADQRRRSLPAPPLLMAADATLMLIERRHIPQAASIRPPARHASCSRARPPLPDAATRHGVRHKKHYASALLR